MTPFDIEQLLDATRHCAALQLTRNQTPSEQRAIENARAALKEIGLTTLYEFDAIALQRAESEAEYEQRNFDARR